MFSVMNGHSSDIHTKQTEKPVSTSQTIPLTIPEIRTNTGKHGTAICMEKAMGDLLHLQL